MYTYRELTNNSLFFSEHKLPAQISLICKLVPPKGRLNKRQKFSTTECIQSLIVNVKVISFN